MVAPMTPAILQLCHFTAPTPAPLEVPVEAPAEAPPPVLPDVEVALLEVQAASAVSAAASATSRVRVRRSGIRGMPFILPEPGTRCGPGHQTVAPGAGACWG